MGILSDLFNKESENFKTISVPTFIKEFSKESDNISELEQILSKLCNEEKKDEISKEIALMKMGLAGESNVNFELKNCTFPFLCLHDIRLEYEGLVAQVDYLIITKRFICVLETKQLQGNVNINSEGEFIRVYKGKNGYDIKTGMYSPIEQNRKHVNLIKRILKEEFDYTQIPIKSVVVMANPKAIINKKYAPKEIQLQIIRAEKLNDYLLDAMKISEYVVLKEETAFKLANYFNDKHSPIVFDYKSKFGLTDRDFIKESTETNSNTQDELTPDTNPKLYEKSIEETKLSAGDMELAQRLKQYRNKKAEEEGLDFRKYHFIFSNAVILSMVESKPENISELFKIKGLGEVKINKYGKDILEILKAYQALSLENENKLQESSIMIDDNKIREKLKAYRLETSRKENIKPYFIFNNEQMEEIIKLKPKSKEELIKVKGFGDVKTEKYGDQIVSILK